MLKHLVLLIAYSISFIFAFQPIIYTYKTVDGLNIQANVYIPESSPYRKYPILFMLHGGGFVAGTKDDFSALEINEILSRGWVGVAIDYRLAPSILLQDIMQDVQDAYQWIRAELVKYYPIDIDNIGVFGGSAGGGLSILSGYILNPRPKVIVAFFPFCSNFTDLYVYDPSTPINNTLIALIETYSQPVITEYKFPSGYSILTDPRFAVLAVSVHNRKASWLLLSEDPNEPADKLIDLIREYSTVYNIDTNYPPTFLGHGLNDTLLPYNQSTMMGDILKANNVNYVLDLVPGANHGYDGLATDPNSDIWINHVLPAFDFAEKQLGKENVIEI